jgi:pimeloyl-ACP methyl ester carboxylesterase
MIIKGLRINYKILGEGKPLLILHGWGSRSANWQKVGELLAEKGIKVIVPDLPGFGQSDRPKEVWSLDDYCDFIEEFAKNLGLERFSLLGHSFGGSLALKLSLRIPEKIDRLYLVSAACFRRKSIKKRILFVLAKVFKIFSFIPFLRKAFYKFIVRKSDYSYTDGIMKEIYLKAIKTDLSDILEKIELPTNIIWGEKDGITSLKQAKIINQRIKDSKLIVIPGADHDLNTKYPEELVNAFLRA